MASLTDTTIYGNLNIEGDLYISGRKVIQSFDLLSEKIQAYDKEVEDQFGYSVAISGDYAIVGALYEDTGGGSAGSAYIFQRTGANTWSTGFKIQAPDKAADDTFGISVAISGDYAIVGSDGKDTGATNAGAAYIFQRTGANTWDTVFKIQASNVEVEGYFGYSVAIDGDYAIVGAPYEDAGATNAGAAYIFQRTGANTWSTGFKIQASDRQADDYFGYSVSISGDYAIVGAYYEDTGGTNAGAAYIFQRTGANTWTQSTILYASDPQGNDQFGRSVAISGDYAIVAAHGKDTGGTNAGAAYIFQRTGTNTWGTVSKIQAPDKKPSDQFGISVAIEGDYAIVGAYGEDTGGDNAGAAYIFHRTGANTWDTGTKIQASDKQAYDWFGWSVAISGDYAIVGANGEDTGGSNAGSAYFYNLNKYLRFE